jgi:hypothetical protein
MKLHKKLFFFFTVNNQNSFPPLVIPAIGVISATFGMMGVGKGIYDERKEKEIKKVEGLFEKIKNVIKDKSELDKEIIHIDEEININNKTIVKSRKDSKDLKNKIKSLTKNLDSYKNYEIENNSSIKEDSSDTDTDDSISNKNFNKKKFILDYEFKRTIEEDKDNLIRLKEEELEINENIKNLTKKNEEKNQEKINLQQENNKKLMSKFFSSCVSLYLHYNEIELPANPSHMKNWKNELNIKMGDHALKTNEEMKDFSIKIVELISDFKLKEINEDNFFTKHFNIINDLDENKFSSILEDLKNNKTVDDKNYVYFLYNVKKYLKKKNNIENIQIILKIFHDHHQYKIEKENLNIIFNNQLKTYSSILKKMKKNQVALILYLICLYTKKNNLLLNNNKQLNKESIVENILYDNFIKETPEIVISSLVNHGKLLKSFLSYTGLSDGDTDNDLLIKIGDSLLNKKNNENEQKIEHDIKTADIISLIAATISNIEPTQTFICSGDLNKLGSLFFTSSLLITNLSVLSGEK